MPHPLPGEVVASGHAAQLDRSIMGPVLAPPRQAGTRTGAGVAWLEALVDQPPGLFVLLWLSCLEVEGGSYADEHDRQVDRPEPLHEGVLAGDGVDVVEQQVDNEGLGDQRYQGSEPGPPPVHLV